MKRFPQLLVAILCLGIAAAASAQTWTPLQQMQRERADYGPVTLTLLPDGRVLASGYYQESEIYDPASGQWTWAASTAATRNYHTVATMANGRVMLIGGHAAMGTAEIYNPVNNTWTTTAPMTTGRVFAAAAGLPDGRVLVVGGSNWNSYESHSTGEIYNPATNTWTLTSMPAGGGEYMAAILMSNGQVLVTGGRTSPGSSVFDPVTNTWATTTDYPANTAVGNMRLVNLNDGRVLMTGGEFDNGRPAATKGAYIFTPATGAWTPVASMNTARSSHHAVRLLDGRVLVTGGGIETINAAGTAYVRTQLASTEIYDPSNNTWTNADAMDVARRGHGMVVLANGTVLVAGGFYQDTGPTKTVEQWAFDPNALPATANAGLDQSFNVCLGCTASVTLDGSGSIGRNSLPLTYTWSKGGVTLATTTDPIDTANVALGPGVHTIQLTVSDGRSSATDIVVITVTQPAPIAPTANAGPDRSIAVCFGCNANVALDGSSSTGNNGGPLTSFVWKEGGNTLASVAAPTLSFAAGVHTLQLTVSDGYASATDTVVITVTQPVAPTVNAGTDQTIAVCFGCSTLVTLTAAGSAGHNNQPLTYTWTEGAVLLGSTQALAFQATLAPGTHLITLTASDGLASATDSVIINIAATLVLAPVANAGPDQTRAGCASCLAPVTLDASASVGRNGLPLTYKWMRGTDTLATTTDPIKTATVNFLVGTHLLTLVVSDAKAAASDTVVITITDPAVTLSQQITALEAQLATRTTERDGLSASLATANTTIAGHVGTIGQLQASLTTANATIASDGATIGQLQGSLATANQSITEKNITIGQLEGQIATANQTIGEQAAQNTALQGALAAASDLATERGTRIVTLETDLAAANESLLQKTAQLAQLGTDLAAANDAIGQRNAQITQLQTELSSADTTIAARNATIAAQVSTIAQRDATIAAQVTTITQRNATIAALTAQIAALQAQVTSLQAQLATALAAATSLEVTFQGIFGDPAFQIPGATLEEQLQNVITAINGLNHGQKQALYKNLGGQKK